LLLVSSIEASEIAKLFALWLEQRLFGGNLSLRMGQEGANEKMMLSRYAAFFLNSRFIVALRPSSGCGPQ
jgi:porin